MWLLPNPFLPFGQGNAHVSRLGRLWGFLPSTPSLADAISHCVAELFGAKAPLVPTKEEHKPLGLKYTAY